MQERGRLPLYFISEDPEEEGPEVTVGLTELLALDGPSALLALIRRHRPLTAMDGQASIIVLT